MKLSEAVAGYVGHKQAMGMRFRTEARILRSFCRTSGEVTMQEVTASQVLAFLAGTGPVTRFWERKHPRSAASIGLPSPGAMSTGLHCHGPFLNRGRLSFLIFIRTKNYVAYLMPSRSAIIRAAALIRTPIERFCSCCMAPGCGSAKRWP